MKNSRTQRLFNILLSEGSEKGKSWLEQNRFNVELYSREFELDRAAKTLMELEKYSEAKVMAELYQSEIFYNDDPYYILAELALQEGNEELALHYLKQGVTQNDVITFMELASRPSTTYMPTTLPDDTTKLFKPIGDFSLDTAYVFIQGGPMPDLSAYHPRPLELLPKKKEKLRIDVLQSQMINQTILTADPILTDDQCLFEHQQSAEMMHRVIQYLKNQGKTVIALGHSYGCFIGYEYLDSKENLADQLILMGADLDENPKNFALNEDGSRKFIRWKYGVEPYETDFWIGFPLLSLLKPKMQKIFTNTGNLVAAKGKRKYTQLLKDKDLSNVIFYYARYDEANGRTSQTELDFFSTHGAKTFESFGDHHSMLTREYMTNIYHHVAKNAPLKTSVAAFLAHQMKSMSADRAIELYQNASDKSQFFPVVESEINELGYELARAENLSDAIKIFQFNVDHFPNSWNVYDSLAETYLIMESQLLAKINYQKSLEIHPGNIYAIQALRTLK